jgi:hypothetical protein
MGKQAEHLEWQSLFYTHYYTSPTERGRMGEQGICDYPVKWVGGESNGDTLFFLLPIACSHHTLSHSLASLFSTHFPIGESLKLIVNLLNLFKRGISLLSHFTSSLRKDCCLFS